MELKDLYEGFRDPKAIKAVASKIQKQAANLQNSVQIMEVCGGHTHAIMQYGLKQLLPDNVSFIHGPGCPVCVMPKLKIDEAIALAQMQDTIVVTLGDMIKVPGSKASLADARGQGADVRFVYSPLQTLKIAQDNPDKKVIFIAIGFETTTPMTAALLKQVINWGQDNVYFHINHVLVPPAMRALLNDKNNITGFIGPSHVSVIEGSKIYEEFARDYDKPVVVAGFEPLDIMQSILMLLQQINEGSAEVQNQYTRCVSREGNTGAQALNQRFFQPDDFVFRGLGLVKDGGLRLKDAFSDMDAAKVFANYLPKEAAKENKYCICGEILKGKALPTQCKLFGKGCDPADPQGSCMVSSEGACAAYFKYGEKA